MSTNAVHSGGGPEFFDVGQQQRTTGTADTRKTEMKPSVSGGGSSKVQDVLNKLAEQSTSTANLRMDAIDYLKHNGDAGVYQAVTEDASFVLVKFNDGSVFSSKLEGTLKGTVARLTDLHFQQTTYMDPNFAAKQKDAPIPASAQKRIDSAVEAAGGKVFRTVDTTQSSATLDAHSAAGKADKPSRGFWATVWSYITTAATETATFFDGVGTQMAAYLSDALSKVDVSSGSKKTDQATQPDKTPLVLKQPGKTPVEMTRGEPLDTLETSTRTRLTSDNNGGSDFSRELGGQPRIDFRAQDYKGRMNQLQKGMTGALAVLGAKSDGPTTDYYIKRSISTTLPHISDLDALDDSTEYEMLSDNEGNKVVFTGAEIKRMAKSATAWSLGGRGKPFTDPGLAKGLTKDNLLPMMRAVTWSEVPRPMADQSGNIIPREAGDKSPAHFICNVSAPDLTLPEIASVYTSESGAVDVGKIKEEFINNAVNEFVDQCLESGVQQLTIPAVGLGAFRGRLTPDQQKEYAQAIMEAAAKRIAEKDTGGQIQVVAFSGAEFSGVDQSFVDQLKVPDHLSLVLTNNETTSCEIAAGKAGLRSATLNAGDQNKLPGCHAFDSAKKVLDGGDPYITHVAQDEAQQLKNPFFALFQSPVFNSYFRDQLQLESVVDLKLCREKIAARGLDQNNWSPLSVYNDDELLGEMVKWAEDARPSLGVEKGSLDPIHYLGDVKELEKIDSGSSAEFSDSFDRIYDKYLKASDGSFDLASSLEELEDSYLLNVGGGVPARAKELFEVPKSERDDKWRKDVLNFLKGPVLDNVDGINRDSTFDSFQRHGNLSPVLMFTDAVSSKR